MSEADFQAVPEVEIDTGVFKYVLIRLYRFLETEIVTTGGIMFIFLKKTPSVPMMLMLFLPNNASFHRDDGEDTREEKDLVRGYNFAEYHADVYDRTEEEVDFFLLINSQSRFTDN